MNIPKVNIPKGQTLKRTRIVCPRPSRTPGRVGWPPRPHGRGYQHPSVRKGQTSQCNLLIINAKKGDRQTISPHALSVPIRPHGAVALCILDGLLHPGVQGFAVRVEAFELAVVAAA
jgi:hypothetical protein